MTTGDTLVDQAPLTINGQKKQLEALRRAVPVTRMVDYGVPLGDALNIHARSACDNAPAWDVLCEQIAQRHLEGANEADIQGHAVTAQQAWRAASALLQCAQLAFNRDGPRKLELYQRSHAAFARGARDVSHAEELTVPTPRGNLNGWVVRPTHCVPQAAVLVLGGLSGWGSVYFDMAQALAARGLLAVLGEGPGQGLTRMRSGLHLDTESLPLFKALLDVAAIECGDRVGVWGNSFGGLFAAHVAANDPRVKAVCINGAPFAPTIPSFRTAREQMQAVFGVDEDALAEKLAALAMSTARHRIDGAMLVVEGGRDPMVPLGEQRAFLELGRPDRSHVLSWEDGEHTIYNHAAARNALVADWFSDWLLA
jgi:alpha-beta hydrolase superfamily lysophospholipase